MINNIETIRHPEIIDCDIQPDKPITWQVDYDYLGRPQNCFYPQESTEVEDTHEELEQEAVYASATTLQEVLTAMMNASSIILEVNPSSQEELTKILEFFENTPSGQIILTINDSGFITETTDLSTLGFEDAIVGIVSDTGCLYNNQDSDTNKFDSQPTANKKYIELGDYYLNQEQQILATIETPAGQRTYKKIFDTYLTVSPENINEVIDNTGYLSSTRSDEHGLVVTNEILAHIKPEDAYEPTDEEKNIKILCSRDALSAETYDNLMNAGADAVLANRSMSLGNKSWLIGYWNELMQPLISDERIAPLMINSLANNGKLSSFIYEKDPLSSYIFGVSAYDIEPAINPTIPNNLTQYSNFPNVDEYTNLFYAAAYGSFNPGEGGNQEFVYKHGTSMSAPFIFVEIFNYLNGLTNEERDALKGLKPYEIFQKAMDARNAYYPTYQSLKTNISSEIVVPSSLILNSVPNDFYNPSWQAALTGTIFISDTLSNYHMANLAGLDWTGQTPIVNPNITVTNTVGYLANLENFELKASVVMTDSEGPKIRIFYMNNAIAPLDQGLITQAIPMNIKASILYNEQLRTIPINRNRYIKLGRRAYQIYLPIVVQQN